MHVRLSHELQTILIITTFVHCLNDSSKSYEIENSEKKIDYDNPTLPEAESYVIGVKRALLPFRQLSKYLRRPVNDPRASNTHAGVQWKFPQEIPEVVVKTQNQKRWYKGEMDDQDKEPYCPEIILIRPINLTQEGRNKINRVNTEINNAITARLRQDINSKALDGSQKPSNIKSPTTGGAGPPAGSPSSQPGANKKLKIDNQIFQGNGINIKLTFSVDVGNQTKAGDNNSTNKPLKKLSANRRRP